MLVLIYEQASSKASSSDYAVCLYDWPHTYKVCHTVEQYKNDIPSSGHQWSHEYEMVSGT